ncbi:MAG TPA: hypothetical protein DCS43_10760 [Verrucomicrobia bacterium]|nr:hypothetical protein [Verrucomicrobiota bacterium]
MPYSYKVFGLSVESSILCPELLQNDVADGADIVIRFGEVPEALENADDAGARWQTAPGIYLLNLKRVGRFMVRAGREIVIQPVEPMSEDSIRTFLLSTCLSIVLHQRKLFALHVSGIHTERGAVLFAGHSGAGKSTLVSAFLKRGFQMVSDDMLALTVDEEDRVRVLPGFPQVKLWADSAEALGRSTEGLRRVLTKFDKFFAPTVDAFHPQSASLHAIYLLGQHNSPEFSLEPLGQSDRFNGLLDNTWQKLTLAGLGLREWHFMTAARIASHVYSARVTRPQHPFRLAEMTDLIEMDFQRELQPLV